ncbi:MAG: ATP-binding cassette domain-containing protein [Trichlorobacter sp.]|jgi:phospholipid/cholesterol/gamma-HCH transport system ATP-binding protein|nr:ATP-binding cassette domain-containing protein [Trichlorobacter sp.]
MKSILSCIELAVPDVANSLNLELESGCNAVFLTRGEHETKALTRTFTGELPPAKGELYFENICVNQASRQQLHSLRQSIGVISSSGNLISNLKLWENITLPLQYHTGNISEEKHDEIFELLKAFDYKGNIWALPGHLSSFERVMASFIRAAITEAKLVIYSGCFHDLTVSEQNLLIEQSITLKQNKPELTALYFINNLKTMDGVEYDLLCDLTQQPALIKRN